MVNTYVHSPKEAGISVVAQPHHGITHHIGGLLNMIERPPQVTR